MNTRQGYGRGYEDLDADTAPVASRPLLAATESAFGFVPSAMRRMALVPELPRAFQRGLASFDGTSLTPVEREVVILTMATRLACDVCVAMHVRALRALGADALVSPLVEGGSTGDPRLDALVAMTRGVLEGHGDVDEATWRAFLGAGFARAQALELVLGIGTYTLSIYANRLTQAPVDAAFR